MTDEEQYLHETLDWIREDYARAAKPYIDRLIFLKSLKPTQYVITEEQAKIMGINYPPAAPLDKAKIWPEL
jgi:hypothetical protein